MLFYLDVFSCQFAKEFLRNPPHEQSAEIRKAFPGYEVVYGVFSKSGFTQRLLDVAAENPSLLLVNEDNIM